MSPRMPPSGAARNVAIRVWNNEIAKYEAAVTSIGRAVITKRFL